MRAHLTKTIRDEEGNLVAGATVRILNARATTPISGSIYTSDASSETLTNPFVASSGAFSIYLDEPQRVRLGVTPPGGAEVFYEDIDVILPQDISTGPTTPELHPGTGEGSLQIGPAADASGLRTVALGRNATASADYGTAVGNNSQALGVEGVAVGDEAEARGLNTTAVGGICVVVGDNGTGVGFDIHLDATALRSSVFGAQAVSYGPDCVVVGYAANDGGEPNSVVIGKWASVTATSPGDCNNTVVIGTNASADNAYSSVVIGVEASAVDASVVAVGHNARGWGYASIAVGPETLANGDSGLAMGDHARADGTASVAVGSGAWALADDSIALGDQVKIQATATSSWGIGGGLNITDPNVGVMRANTVEIVPQPFPSPLWTALILHDTSGNRWRITVDTTGHLTTEAL